MFEDLTLHSVTSRSKEGKIEQRLAVTRPAVLKLKFLKIRIKIFPRKLSRDPVGSRRLRCKKRKPDRGIYSPNVVISLPTLTIFLLILMYLHVYPVQRMALWVKTNFLSPFDVTRTMSLWNIIGIPWAGVIIFFFSQECPVKKFQFHRQTGHVIRCTSATSEQFSKPHFDLWQYLISISLISCYNGRVWFGPHIDSPKHKFSYARWTSRWKF